MFNSLVLAYVGDSVYDLYIRKYLVEQGYVKVKDLQNQSIKYVSAIGQATILKQLCDHCLLSKQELDIVRMARNHKSHRHPKNTDIITYKYATGLEALIGYLYLNNNNKRLEEIMNFVKEVIC